MRSERGDVCIWDTIEGSGKGNEDNDLDIRIEKRDRELNRASNGMNDLLNVDVGKLVPMFSRGYSERDSIREVRPDLFPYHRCPPHLPMLPLPRVKQGRIVI